MPFLSIKLEGMEWIHYKHIICLYVYIQCFCINVSTTVQNEKWYNGDNFCRP
jgi:hypothetical protein